MTLKEEVKSLRKKNLLDEEEVIRLFKKYKPEDYDEVESVFKLKYLGSGIFRRAYQIRGLDLVVKTPDGASRFDSNLRHAKEEIRKIQRIRKAKKYSPLRRYLPKIHYFNKYNGVMLMTKYSKWPSNTKDVVTQIISNLITDLRGHEGDLHENNIARDEWGEPVIIDLGYF
jgi:hypothetical protein